ncbi:UNVERIFIED_CONTAM: hypothetical protein Sradi_1360700 [Sesamum radiatum]|uniref:N-acetyltransferase domain-containing protein n=1 Tax=Sesamum radiatum TaxID=300843 RepID=A0AAW2URE7_SESRA
MGTGIGNTFEGGYGDISCSVLWKLEVHCNNDQSIRYLAPSRNESSKLPDLSFDRLQLTDKECTGLQKRNFGRFVARKAILDEEYWTAAWLRAEAHWESLSYMRHVDSYKRKYAEEMKKEDRSVRRTVLNSIVGTLDLSIRQFLQGETYPGEIKKLSAVLASPEPFDTHKYAYIANVCVAKFARRQGIASNMLYLARCSHDGRYPFSSFLIMQPGMKQLFVHVNADNKPAQDLYIKTGFKM